MAQPKTITIPANILNRISGSPAKVTKVKRRSGGKKRTGFAGLGEMPSMFIATWIMQFASGLVRSLLLSLKVEEKWIPIAIPAAIYWLADSGKIDIPGLKTVALVSLAREAGVSLGLSKAGYYDGYYNGLGSYQTRSQTGYGAIADLPPRTPQETLRLLQSSMGPAPSVAQQTATTKRQYLI